MTSYFASIFSECQRSIATHKKCIKLATDLLLKDDKAFKEFLVCVDRVLVVDKRHPAVERCVSFIGQFIASYSADPNSKPLWAPMLSHLLERSNVKDASIRFRVCQIVAEMLSLMPEDIEIDDDIWDKLSTKMIVRTKDKAAVTRAHAARALARLQDPSSSNPSQEVRKVVLSQIGISKKTLPHIIQRSRDTCDEIRRDTYQLIGKKVDIRALTIAQRLYILEEGLQDRSDEVRKAAVAMTAGWQNLDTKDTESCGGIVLLLKCLDIESEGESVGVMVLKELHKAGLLQLPELSFASLTPETALVWRVMCEIWKEQKDAMLESLPEVSQLCRIIVQQNAIASNGFVVRQLILLSKFVDLADEVGRRSLNALICQLLSDLNTPLEYTTPLLELLHSLHTPKDFASLTLEIISELRYPLYEGKVQNSEAEHSSAEPDDSSAEAKIADEELRAKTQAQLHELRKQLALVTAKQLHKKKSTDKTKDAEEAAYLQQEIAQLEEVMELLAEKISKRDETESKIWCQSLDITLYLLQSTNHMKEHSGIMEIHSVLLIKALSHPLPIVRARGVCCTILYCLLDQAATLSHIPIFLELLNSDLPPIQLTVLKGLFDLAACFGVPLLQETFSFKNEIQPLLSYISPYLFHEDDDFRSVSVEGFAKLYMADIVTTPQYFTNLVLYFFNPTTADDLELRQCLSVFFPAFAVCNFKTHSALIEASFVPTLKTYITNAPGSSPIKKIPALQVAQFLLSLLDTAFLRKLDGLSGARNHAKIAVDLSHEILANTAINKELCKVLSYFNITDEDQDLVKVIRFLVDEMLEDTVLKREKLIHKGLTKLSTTLARADRTPEATLSPSKRDKLKETTKELSTSYDVKVNAQKAIKQNAQQRKAPAKKSRVYISDSESSEDISEDSESSEEEEEEEEDKVVVKAPARAPSTRRANLAAKSKLQSIESTEESSEESEQEDDSSENDTSDDLHTEKSTKIQIASPVIAEEDEPQQTPLPAKIRAPSKKIAKSVVPEPSSSEVSDASNSDSSLDSPKPRAKSAKVTRTDKTVHKSHTECKTNTENSPVTFNKRADAEAEKLAMFSSVRQVKLYESSDEDCDVSLVDSEDEDLEGNKENVADNIVHSVCETPVNPSAGTKSMDTTKKQLFQELHQEIDDLLADDPMQSFVQRTADQVSRLLLDDTPTNQRKHSNPPTKATVVKTKIHAAPVKVAKTSPPSKQQASSVSPPQAKLPSKPSPPTKVFVKPSVVKSSKPSLTSTAPSAPKPVLGKLVPTTTLKPAKSPPVVAGSTAIHSSKPRTSSISSIKPVPPKPLQQRGLAGTKSTSTKQSHVL